MSSGKRSIRFKIFSLLLLPLLSLSALWGFVLNLTVGDGLSLMRANTIYQSLGLTSTDLGLQVQAERSVSATASGSAPQQQDRMAAQRRATDASLAKFRAAALSGDTRSASNDATRDATTALLNELEQLPGIRANVDSGQSTRLATIQAYNQIMDGVFRLYDRMVSVPDLSIFEQAGAMQSMGQAREIIARENALVTAAIARDGLSDAEYEAFAEWVANRRFQYAKGMAMLEPDLRKPYEEVFASPTFKRFITMEQDIIDRARATGPLPPSVSRWQAITDNLSAMLDQVGSKASGALADRALSVATGILLRIGIAGGLGLIAVVASIVISVRFGRRLIRELADLRNSARELAGVRLPRVVDRLRKGEEVDVEAEAPPIPGGDSAEVHDVAEAFGSVQRTAVRAAVEQADLRRGVSQVFLNLARRKQGLLHRQLRLLDTMQRRASDPEALEDLFQLDHLTTRMRRHAESLIILSGAAPGRAWRKPVPVMDVVRAAVAEVEGYTRVNVFPLPNAFVAGAAVADIIHLIAELIENATVFSPPRTRVQVRGDSVANGFVVEIEDRGLGLSPEEYASINQRLAQPPEFDLADSDRLGLFVVGQLAARNNVSVVLRASPYGGTTAIVLIPRQIVSDDASPAPLLVADTGPRHARGPLPVLSAAEATDTAGTARTADAPAAAGEVDKPAEESPSPYFTPARTGDSPSLTVVPGLVNSDDGPATDPAITAITDTGPPSTVPPQRTPAPKPKAAGTHAGLPRRVRQASMAPQLRDNKQQDSRTREAATPLAAPTPSADTGPTAPERSPDETRAMFSAFQQGGRRGRLESEQDPGENSAAQHDRPNEHLSRHDGAQTPPEAARGEGEEPSERADRRDPQRGLRDHSEGYVHQATGEKGDE
ncbi:nitrate- and nitrite sensing domain-containing protein [Sphaerisporangium rubeum]|uniref:histidine kinase n=1 Tax=Sphaerisporangium rubeum TaxID=321317 RepID=A0A7X0I9H8_9ACTN|nr:nitrate- and nitrite sensing domain-containing protein [Sphaerisporangium rubeum]MBB6471101.1 signal transduction histidine kinase [Sphaerisporangium rubeum]